MALATVTLKGKQAHEVITLTREQAIYLLDLLSDPNEIAQVVAYLAKHLGTKAAKAIEPPSAPTPPAPTPAPEPTPPSPKVEVAPSAPKPEPKPKATKTRKPRRVKTPIVIIDTLKPISGISALPGIPLPSPTATCAVSSPSPTPNAQSGTGAEKIASAAIERETLNERDLADLRQRAQELGLKCHKTKGISADTLRARIAIAEAKLAAKVNIPVAVAAPVKPVAVKTARTVTDDFVNVLHDGRKLYTIVYSDGTIESEIGKAAQAA